MVSTHGLNKMVSTKWYQKLVTDNCLKQWSQQMRKAMNLGRRGISTSWNSIRDRALEVLHDCEEGRAAAPPCAGFAADSSSHKFAPKPPSVLLPKDVVKARLQSLNGAYDPERDFQFKWATAYTAKLNATWLTVITSLRGIVIGDLHDGSALYICSDKSYSLGYFIKCTCHLRPDGTFVTTVNHPPQVAAATCVLGTFYIQAQDTANVFPVRSCNLRWECNDITLFANVLMDAEPLFTMTHLVIRAKKRKRDDAEEDGGRDEVAPAHAERSLGASDYTLGIDADMVEALAEALGIHAAAGVRADDDDDDADDVAFVGGDCADDSFDARRIDAIIRKNVRKAGSAPGFAHAVAKKIEEHGAGDVERDETDLFDDAVLEVDDGEELEPSVFGFGDADDGPPAPEADEFHNLEDHAAAVDDEIFGLHLGGDDHVPPEPDSPSPLCSALLFAWQTGVESNFEILRDAHDSQALPIGGGPPYQLSLALVSTGLVQELRYVHWTDPSNLKGRLVAEHAATNTVKWPASTMFPERDLSQASIRKSETKDSALIYTYRFHLLWLG